MNKLMGEHSSACFLSACGARWRGVNDRQTVTITAWMPDNDHTGLTLMNGDRQFRISVMLTRAEKNSLHRYVQSSAMIFSHLYLSD